MAGPTEDTTLSIAAEALGSAAFRRDYGVRLAYTAGSMYQGIASESMVLALANAGLLGFFGSGGLSFESVEEAIATIQGGLPGTASYGMNLLSEGRPDAERRLIDLYLERGVRNVEASAFLRITAPLVLFRLRGLRRNAEGDVIARQRVIAKASRREVAEAFMSPPPLAIARSLHEAGDITAEELELSQQIPLAQDVCVEADSGGHTDQGVAFTLVPTIVALRNEIMQRHRYRSLIRVGAAGGIGTPEAVAAAFILGADFVTTGSVNQCTVEAGTSDAVKDLLQGMDIHDTAYAPAGDLFEMGSRVQVLKKGLLFPARANRLFDLYRQYDSLEALPAGTRETLEKYFRRTLDEVWEETRAFYARYRPEELERAERTPKARMALVFRWYFVQTNRLARSGGPQPNVDYQIHCGPALGAFNRWVRGTNLENWRSRHVAVIADRLMSGAAQVLSLRLAALTRNA